MAGRISNSEAGSRLSSSVSISGRISNSEAGSRRNSSGSISEWADQAELPEDDDAPLAGGRHGVLQQNGPKTLGMYYARCATFPGEVAEDDVARGKEARAGATGERRRSILETVQDTLWPGGRKSEVGNTDVVTSAPGKRQPRQTLGSMRSSTATRQSEAQRDSMRPMDIIEAVQAMYFKALRVANVSKYEKRHIEGRPILPISKNFAAMKDKLDAKAAEGTKETCAEKAPTNRLAEWFEAGLQRYYGMSEGIEGKRPVPSGYAVAEWASDFVPLIRHKQTGVIIWPVRFDLMPVFRLLQGKSKSEAASAQKTTVFHFTSSAGFQRIVAPLEYTEESPEAQEQQLAENVWDRLEEDLYRHEVPRVEGAPEFSLAMLGSEPSMFNSNEALARAVYRTNTAQLGAGQVGFCVALRVPADCCRAVAGKQNAHTVVLVPPGIHYGGLDEEGGGAKPGKARRLLVQWKERSALLGRKAHTSATAEVKSMNLLEGIVDTSTGQTVLDAEATDGEARKLSGQSGKDEEEERQHEEEEPDACLSAKIAQLQKEQTVLKRKIHHAQTAQQQCAAGEQVRFLATDGHRLLNLRKRLNRCTLQLEEAQRNLSLYQQDSGSEADSYTGAETEHAGLTGEAKRILGRKAAGVQRRHRRVKVKVKNASEFCSDILEVVQNVEEEYEMQSGDILREVFGGNTEGVKAWLQDPRNSVNAHHESTGWTPLHMATSMGDPDMVKVILRHGGDIGQTTLTAGWSAVHFAVWKNSVRLLQLLLKADSNCVKFKTKNGETPLFMVVNNSAASVRDEMVRVLLDVSANPNTKQKDEWSPLALAVVRNYRVIVKLLVEHRGNIFDDCPDTPGKTIWQASARHPGLQKLIKTKLNSRDLHLVEKHRQENAGHQEQLF